MNSDYTNKRFERYKGLDVTPPTIEKPVPGEDRQEFGVPMSLPEKYSTNNMMLEPESDDSQQQAQGQEHAQSPDQTDAPSQGPADSSVEDHLNHALENQKEMMSMIDANHSSQQNEEVNPEIEAHLQAAIDNQKEMLDSTSEQSLPVSDEMEDNVSRPEGYDQSNTPGDMGLSEDEEEAPDLTEVLKDGLDSHSDQIQREKIVQLTSEALKGFKANKQILERAKDKAPELYSSCIAMLRAMIEMSKALGLGEEPNPLEEPQSEAQESTIEPEASAVAGEAAAQAPQQ